MATRNVDTQAQCDHTGIENVQTSQNNVQVLIDRKCSRNIVRRGFLARNTVGTRSWVMVGRGFVDRKGVPTSNREGVPTSNREGVPTSRNRPGPFFQLLPNGLP